MKRLTRRTFLLAALPGSLATGVGTLAYGHKIGAEWLRVSRHRVPIEGAGKSPLRLLHLSDFHWSPEVSLEAIADGVALGLTQKPDLICLTGDYLTKAMPGDPADYAAVLKPLAESAPTVAVFGNHDGRTEGPEYLTRKREKLLRVMDAAGIRILVNAVHRESFAGGWRIDIVGLGDLWLREMDVERAFAGLSDIAGSVRSAEKRPPRLVLAHNPDSKAFTLGQDWDLMLSGHTHGGQLIVPILGWRPVLPVRDKHHVDGLYRWEGRWLHVSRGIGNLHGLRYNCRPEVSLLVLEATVT